MKKTNLKDAFKNIVKDKKVGRLRKSYIEATNYFKKGNFLILAVGFISGLIFKDLVSSLANDIILGAISSIYNFKNADINSLAWHGIKYGKFIGILINFILITFVLFIILIVVFFIKSFITDFRKKSNPPIEETVEKQMSIEEQILEQLKLINDKLNNSTQNIE
ncbi:MscL family protein [Mycoplasma sp. CSL10137]|uniref:MscL family protein n=1 Tax=Mycoplasma sp. CSL10137 TaxID=2813824 RepID=UPI00197BDA54|nr:MscL family protein [Mycoplasma sp. CSL10137]MBN4083525.1 MscL family protein [Mycoplasma sp. CSL10137]